MRASEGGVQNPGKRAESADAEIRWPAAARWLCQRGRNGRKARTYVSSRLPIRADHGKRIDRVAIR